MLSHIFLHLHFEFRQKRKMKHFVKIVLVLGLVGHEIAPNIVTFGTSVHSMASSFYSYNGHSNRKNQVEQCHRIMNHWENLPNETIFHYEYDDKERVSLYVKVLTNKILQFFFDVSSVVVFDVNLH